MKFVKIIYYYSILFIRVLTRDRPSLAAAGASSEHDQMNNSLKTTPQKLHKRLYQIRWNGGRAPWPQ